MGRLWGGFGEALGMLWGRFGEALGRLSGAVGRLWESGEALVRLWEALGNLWGDFGRLWAGFGEALGRLSGAVGRLWDALGVWGGFWETLGGFGETLGTGTGGPFSPMWTCVWVRFTSTVSAVLLRLLPAWRGADTRPSAAPRLELLSSRGPTPPKNLYRQTPDQPHPRHHISSGSI